MSSTRDLSNAGVSIWLDYLSRDLLEDGGFRDFIGAFSVVGATSNPTIFESAIGGSSRYEEQIKELVNEGQTDLKEMFFALAILDVQNALDLLKPIYDKGAGADGFVSFECTPDVAYDAKATIVQGYDLWQRINRPNAMIKVPATQEGLVAIEDLTYRGVNVNVTLLFSLERYEQVIESYLRGLERRVEENKDISGISSVASFFVSRVDAKAEEVLDTNSDLIGEVAIANAHLAYELYLDSFRGERWEKLANKGARRQRPLWASTGTKNPALPDTHYLERLVAKDTVNTVPEKTLRAFADHGQVGEALKEDTIVSKEILARAKQEGVDLKRITSDLETEGVESFSKSYDSLLLGISEQIEKIKSAS